MKIAIIGYPGSGKRKLADQIEGKYYCAKLCLDDIDFPGETRERNIELTRELLNGFMEENISWVIEGDDFEVLFDERMDIADKIVIMKYNRFLCLFKMVKDHLERHQKVDGELISWILFGSRTSERRAQYNRIMRQYSEKVILLFNPAQLFMLKDLI